MAEIKVLVAKDAPPLVEQSAEERFLTFDRLMERMETAGYAESMLVLVNKAIQWNELTARPNVIELLIRKLIGLYTQDGLNYVVIPVANPTPIKTGGASPPRKFISITMQTRTRCVSEKNKKWIAAPGQEIQVLGLLFNSGVFANKGPNWEKLPLDSLKEYYETALLHRMYLESSQFHSTFPPETSQQIPYVIYQDMRKSDPDGLIDRVNKIAHYKINSTDRQLALVELIQRGFLPVIYADDKSTGAFIEIRKQADKWRAFMQETRKKQAAIANLLGTYLMIIESKLGATRLNVIEDTISAKPHLAGAPEKVLDLLKPAEKSLVLKEYSIRAKYLAEQLNNKCAHVAALRKFRRDISSEDQSNDLKSLKGFFQPGKHEIHSCKICKFEIMCSHLVEYYEATFADKPQTVIKALMTKYIDSSVSRTTLFCKHCGELISTMDAFEDSINTSDLVVMDEELRTFIWSEVAALMKTLRFTNVVNTSQLITSIRDAIYPFMYDVEKMIMRSKTNSSAEIKAKKRLYSTIYAYAYIIRLVLSNKTIGFKNFEPSGKNPLVDYIRHAIGLTMGLRNVVIQTIPGMNQDIIKNSLVEAYKSMTALGSQIITHTEAPEDLENLIILDPAYKFIYLVNNVFGGKLATKASDMVDKIASYVGNPVFDKIKIPNMSAAQLKKSHLYSRVDFRDYFYEILRKSYIHFVHMIQSRVYTNAVYKESGVKTSSKDPQAIAEPITYDKFTEQWDKWLSISSEEEIALKRRGVAFVKTFGEQSRSSSRMWEYRGYKLSRLYDENGNPHKFTIAVLDDDKELSIVDISGLLSSGKRLEGNVKDHKCSVCGVLKSQLDTLSEDKIKESIDSNINLDNFYRFYEQRCPAGGLHEWPDQVCSKCGKDLSKPADVEYYKKWRKTYLSDRAEHSERVELPEAAKIEAAVNDFKDYSANAGIVTTFSERLGLNQRFLVALGSVERIEYAEVASGKYIPYEPEDRFETRSFLLTSFIRTLLTDYNQLRFYYRLGRPPQHLTQLLEDSRVSHQDYPNLPTLMPAVGSGVFRAIDEFRTQRRPRDIPGFCLEQLCQIASSILDIKEPNTDKLREAFVKSEFEKFLRGDELWTKAGYFNWSILYGEKTMEKTDSNYTEEGEGGATADDDDDEGTPLANGFDVDDENLDPEDSSNQVRVEGHGLD
jgi:hypothetical protein